MLPYRTHVETSPQPKQVYLCLAIHFTSVHCGTRKKDLPCIYQVLGKYKAHFCITEHSKSDDANCITNINEIMGVYKIHLSYVKS